MQEINTQNNGGYKAFNHHKIMKYFKLTQLDWNLIVIHHWQIFSRCSHQSHSFFCWDLLNLTCTALHHSLGDQWHRWSRVQHHLNCNTTYVPESNWHHGLDGCYCDYAYIRNRAHCCQGRLLPLTDTPWLFPWWQFFAMCPGWPHVKQWSRNWQSRWRCLVIILSLRTLLTDRNNCNHLGYFLNLLL